MVFINKKKIKVLIFFKILNEFYTPLFSSLTFLDEFFKVVSSFLELSLFVLLLTVMSFSLFFNKATNLGWIPANLTLAEVVTNGPGGGSGLLPDTASESLEVNLLKILKKKKLIILI